MLMAITVEALHTHTHTDNIINKDKIRNKDPSYRLYNLRL